MKALLRATLLLLGGWIPFSSASPLESSSYDNIVYFADSESSSVQRYSLVAETFLDPLSLTQNPLAIHVDGSGIYISYGKDIVKLDLAGASETEYRSTSYNVVDIESNEKYLFLSGYVNWAGDSYLQVVSKIAGTLVDGKDLSYFSPHINISMDGKTIFTTSMGISPMDIYQISIGEDGAIGATMESPYHGDYEIGEHPIKFPTQGRIVDTSGNVYNTSNLTFAGNLGGAFQKIIFWQGLPVVLRNGKLFSYNQFMQETGTFTLTADAVIDIAIYGNKVFSFGVGDLNQINVEVVDVNILTPVNPFEPLDPTNLEYLPDAIELDVDQDTVYLLSKSQLNIFRWSISQQKYLSSIPLANAPQDFSYQSTQQRIYLTYIDGTISYIDMDTDMEMQFSKIGDHASIISNAGNLILVSQGKFGFWGSIHVYDQQGKLSENNMMHITHIKSAWDPVYRRLYFYDTYLTRFGVNESGELIRYSDSYYDAGWNGSSFIRVSENGRYIALSNGTVVDFRMALVRDDDGYEAHYTTDMAWLNGNLFSLKWIDNNTHSQLDRWNANFTRDIAESKEIVGLPLGLIPIPSANKLLVISRQNGKPVFESFEFLEIDFDEDGVPDSQDLFPADATETVDFDSDGIGDFADTDADNDSVIDSEDAFPTDPDETLDTDNDNAGNNGDTDDDNDGINDDRDFFPVDPGESSDMDGDGIGDNSDIDRDGDFVTNEADDFPENSLEWQDTDTDGVGNNSDSDDDGDGVADNLDFRPLDASESKDSDGDGIGDNSDPDRDGDGVANGQDSFPNNASEWLDSDSDGRGNNADSDDDNDSVADITDFYPLDASKSNINANDFLPLAKGNQWIYDQYNAPVTLGNDKKIANQTIRPIQFPHGYNIYLKVVNNQVQLFGFYFADVDVGFGPFSADFMFNKGVDLLSSNNQSGKGTVNINPQYGKKDMSWSVNVTYLGSESLALPAGQYSGMHTRVSFTGSTTIDGQPLQLTYSVDYWFAEDVGLVQLAENGWTMSLVGASINDPVDDNPETPTENTSGGGGGGSINYWLLILLILLLPKLATRKNN